MTACVFAWEERAAKLALHAPEMQRYVDKYWSPKWRPRDERSEISREERK